jgi:WD40 repeat protein
MADIFISYGRADAARVERLVRVLETKWSVFWDRTIPPGQTWDDYIGRQLETSRCVVVIWSTTSVASEWVREEAHHGRDRGALVPVLLDKVSPPFGFRQVQAADLTTWNGLAGDRAIDLLMKTLEQLLPAAERAERSQPDSPPADIVPESARPVVVGEISPMRGAGRSEKDDESSAGTLQPTPSSWPAGSFLRSRAARVGAAVCAVAAVLTGVWALTPWSDPVRVRRGEGYTDLIHAARVDAVTFSADGNTLATSVDGAGVRLWHLDDLSRASTLIEEFGNPGIAFHPRAPVLATGSGKVSLRRLDDLEAEPFTLPESYASYGVAFSADGQLLASTDGDGAIGLWRLVNGTTAEVVGRRKGGGHSRYGMALSPDGEWLAADRDGDRGIVDVWRTGGLDAEPTIVGDTDATAWDVAFSQDSRLLAAATGTGLYLWETQNLQGAPRTLSTIDTWSVVFSPDGQFLAAGDHVGIVTLWRLGDTTPASKLNLGDRVDTLAFSPDGRTLAAGSFSGVVRLWQLP